MINHPKAHHTSEVWMTCCQKRVERGSKDESPGLMLRAYALHTFTSVITPLTITLVTDKATCLYILSHFVAPYLTLLLFSSIERSIITIFEHLFEPYGSQLFRDKYQQHRNCKTRQCRVKRKSPTDTMSRNSCEP